VVPVAAIHRATAAHDNRMNAEDVAALADRAAGFAPVQVGVDCRDHGKLPNLELVAAALAGSGFDLIETANMADAIGIFASPRQPSIRLQAIWRMLFWVASASWDIPNETARRHIEIAISAHLSRPP
jgi:hypothetical protein